LHDWQMTPEQARRTQLDLAASVSTRNDLTEALLIAGVDISAPNAQGIARAAVVVLRYPDLELTESEVIEQRITFPYIPGLLSFRECPPILAVCAKLVNEPDLIIVDGQGIAHPRRFGLASHLGLLWDKPTIGCAKSRLCGDHPSVPPEPGSYSDVIHQGEVVGAALRTRQGASPLYVSIGHRVDLRSAITWVLRCCRGRRLPETTRLAHLAASGKLNTSSPTQSTSRRKLDAFQA
jgi:deoxyribonuclease V